MKVEFEIKQNYVIIGLLIALSVLLSVKYIGENRELRVKLKQEESTARECYFNLTRGPYLRHSLMSRCTMDPTGRACPCHKYEKGYVYDAKGKEMNQVSKFIEENRYYTVIDPNKLPAYKTYERSFAELYYMADAAGLFKPDTKLSAKSPSLCIIPPPFYI